ncbi:MAG TPA: DUF6580 family putative transport protein [Nitrospiraceae bacterium]|nr:DUF6580 family putative transport protein [Nitrospiraceae bacterium]
MYRLRFFVLMGMILAAAAFRLIPHPPNFAPIGAMALFGGACFADRRKRDILLFHLGGGPGVSGRLHG